MTKTSHKKYSIQFKLKVIDLYKLNVSIHTLSNKLGIDRKTIRDWIKKEKEFLDIKYLNNKFRFYKKSGIKRNFSEEENIISEWIISNRR